MNTDERGWLGLTDWLGEPEVLSNGMHHPLRDCARQNCSGVVNRS